MLPDELTLLDGTEVVTLERGAAIAGVPLYCIEHPSQRVRHPPVHVTTLGDVRYYLGECFAPSLWGTRAP